MNLLPPALYACPLNGQEPMVCKGTVETRCGKPHVHRVEALVKFGQAIPVCQTHGCRLVYVQAMR